MWLWWCHSWRCLCGQVNCRCVLAGQRVSRDVFTLWPLTGSEWQIKGRRLWEEQRFQAHLSARHRTSLRGEWSKPLRKVKSPAAFPLSAHFWCDLMRESCFLGSDLGLTPLTWQRRRERIMIRVRGCYIIPLESQPPPTATAHPGNLSARTVHQHTRPLAKCSIWYEL